MNKASLKIKPFSEYENESNKEASIITSNGLLNQKLQGVHHNARLFSELTLDQRISLLEDIKKGFVDVAESMVQAECIVKGLQIGTPSESEAWALGPVFVVRHLRLLQESLQALKSTGNTNIGKVSLTIDHRLSVNVFPASTIDGILYKDVTIDVHMLPNVTQNKLESDRARFYKKPEHNGRVVLVLGAGNISMIPIMDVLTKMFNEGKVCILKMNPVNAYIGAFIEKAFSKAIADNFLAVVYGNIEESQYLIDHDLVDEIHITGSDKTYNAIVWGPEGKDRDERMVQKKPVLKKEITSELGNVTPVIIVPGPYTDKELAFQAEDIASAFTLNASYNCCTPVSLVTAEGWQQRSLFLKKLEQTLSDIPTRKAYYPGAKDRWDSLTKGHVDLAIMGKENDGHLPWALIKSLSPSSDEAIYKNEPFCSVLAETMINTKDTIEFLERAVDFVNNKLWGSLTANFIIHPASMKDPNIRKAIERAITKLNYGVVTINGFNGIEFISGVAPWGAHPGSEKTNIQSGQGWVHNTLMLEGIEKAVLRFPLVAFPKPPWHSSNRVAHKIMPKLMHLENNPSWTKLPGVIFTVMQG
ncbi:MAG: aldehyde dehydrogenase [Methylophaga sp.]|nr:aldehyde dehydrogenase [Methylophaga sp.]